MPTASRFRLLLPHTILEAMIAHARSELPNECCGLLAGSYSLESSPQEQVHVTNRYPLVNELQSPTEYRSEPRSMFEAMRDMTREIDVWRSTIRINVAAAASKRTCNKLWRRRHQLHYLSGRPVSKSAAGGCETDYEPARWALFEPAMDQCLDYFRNADAADRHRPGIRGGERKTHVEKVWALQQLRVSSLLPTHDLAPVEPAWSGRVAVLHFASPQSKRRISRLGTNARPLPADPPVLVDLQRRRRRLVRPKLVPHALA